MSTDLLKHLKELRPDSGVRIVNSIVHGFHGASNSKGEAGKTLIKPEMKANAQWIWKVNGNLQAYRAPENHFYREKVRSFGEDENGGFIERLNVALQGGKSYPILSLISGAIVGAASSGVGLLFSTTSTVASMSKYTHRVLARPGDQIWKVEELGKVKSGSEYQAVHVLSFFVIDPFRDGSKFRNRGWLIHEERTDVDLE